MEYSDPTRESDPYALPDLEIWHSDDYPTEPPDPPLETGWYYWVCSFGCLPDSEPYGPFGTYDEALDAARDDAEVYDDD